MDQSGGRGGHLSTRASRGALLSTRNMIKSSASSSSKKNAGKAAASTSTGASGREATTAVTTLVTCSSIDCLVRYNSICVEGTHSLAQNNPYGKLSQSQLK